MSTCERGSQRTMVPPPASSLRLRPLVPGPPPRTGPPAAWLPRDPDSARDSVRRTALPLTWHSHLWAWARALLRRAERPRTGRARRIETSPWCRRRQSPRSVSTCSCRQHQKVTGTPIRCLGKRQMTWWIPSWRPWRKSSPRKRRWRPRAGRWPNGMKRSTWNSGLERRWKGLRRSISRNNLGRRTTASDSLGAPCSRELRKRGLEVAGESGVPFLGATPTTGLQAGAVSGAPFSREPRRRDREVGGVSGVPFSWATPRRDLQVETAVPTALRQCPEAPTSIHRTPARLTTSGLVHTARLAMVLPHRISPNHPVGRATAEGLGGSPRAR